MKCPSCLSVFVIVSVFSLLCSSANAGDSANSAVSPSSDAVSTPEDRPITASSQFPIPGPLRSFLRMAGISQKIAPEEVLPLLSRNVFARGYEDSKRQTEFLILLSRYVVQARELTALAEPEGVLRASNCDDVKPLLRILGYRTRQNCGAPDTSLQTADPERAFLTIDSGFPLPELEQTLQGGKPFEYPYTASPVPVLFAAGDWTMASKKNNKESSKDLVDTILSDPTVARLYWALSKLDSETSKSLQRSIGIGKLLPYAAVLDFYGRRLCISGGRVVVPGGVAAESAWKDLVGAGPASPAAFVERLVAKDKGWLAAYFDVLSRASANQQAYFTQGHRLRFFYEGLRAPDTSFKATRGTFRPAPALLLLATRLQFASSGEPLIPGSLEVWKDILLDGHNSNVVRKSTKRSAGLTGPDDLVQLLFTLSRAVTDSGPLQIYMTISELDSRRAPGHGLAPTTVRLLASKFEEFSDQYRIFSEFPELSDESITLFLDAVQRLNSVPMSVRGNAFGIFQANVGIWQILARQGE